MSSLAMAEGVAKPPPDERSEEHEDEDGSMTNESPQSKSSNQEMEMDGNKALGKHLEDFINNDGRLLTRGRGNFLQRGAHLLSSPIGIKGSDGSQPMISRSSACILGLHMHSGPKSTKECYRRDV